MGGISQIPFNQIDSIGLNFISLIFIHTLHLAQFYHQVIANQLAHQQFIITVD